MENRKLKVGSIVEIIIENIPVKHRVYVPSNVCLMGYIKEVNFSHEHSYEVVFNNGYSQISMPEQYLKVLSWEKA